MGGFDLPLFPVLRALAGPVGATALAGTLLRLFASNPSAIVLPGLRASLTKQLPSPRLRLVLAACVRLEDMETVLPPLERLLTALRGATGCEDVDARYPFRCFLQDCKLARQRTPFEAVVPVSLQIKGEPTCRATGINCTPHRISRFVSWPA